MDGEPRRSTRESKAPDRLSKGANQAAMKSFMDNVPAESMSQNGKTPRRKRKKGLKTRTKKRLASQKQGKVSTTSTTKSSTATKRKSTASDSNAPKRQNGVKSQKASKGNSDVLSLNDKKPLPIGEPLVWAEFRQALAETLPYYNSYQSSAYTTGGFCYGFLLAHNESSRLYCDEEIVITRAAGHMEKDNSTQQMVQINDQKIDSNNVQSMIRTMEAKAPVVLIVSKENVQIPTRMPHQYNVLGYFQVTDVWPEMNDGHVCFKYRFEKIDLSERSWWAISGTERSEPDHPIRVPNFKCVYCEVVSKQVLQTGWVCLNQECHKFWRYENGIQPALKANYTDAFLNARTKWPNKFRPPFNLRPSLPPVIPGGQNMYYNKRGWRGICCPHCGCCVSRIHWHMWKCDGCGFEHKAAMTPISAAMTSLHARYEFDGHAVAGGDVSYRFVAERTDTIVGNYRVSKFELLPGNFVFHFQVNRAITQSQGGPDDLFLELQQHQDQLGLKRRVIGNRTDKLSGLSNHFAGNYGMPYKYVMAVESLPFQDAPAPILKAVQRLRWAGKHVGQSDDRPFNECLTIGYFADCKIGFHDDGEKELGPTVATLALGAPSVMKMRMKAKFFDGFSSKKEFDPTLKILPGSHLEHERRELQEKANTTNMQQHQLNAAFKEILDSGPKKRHEMALSLKMSHGDIIIMDGAEVQKYYEHSVESEGNLRFAVTCRHIKWEDVPKEEHSKSFFDEAQYPPYDGATEGMNSPTQDTTGEAASPMLISVTTASTTKITNSAPSPATASGSPMSKNAPESPAAPSPSADDANDPTYVDSNAATCSSGNTNDVQAGSSPAAGDVDLPLVDNAGQ